MIHLLFLAQAGADTAAAPKIPAKSIINPNSTLVSRFEESTGLPGEALVWITNIGFAIGILALGYIGAGVVRNAVRRLLARRQIDPTVGDFVGNIVHAALMAFVVVTALEKVGVDTKTFAAVIAAAGLAIGLALQGGLSNFAAGFLIIVFRPFKKNDVVNAAGIEGVVQEVQIFSTTLHTADNKKIIVPNSSIMGAVITNYTANPTRRIDLQFAVAAGTDLARAQKVLLDVAASEPAVTRDPAPESSNVKLVEGGTLVELRAWCATEGYAGALSSLIAKAPAALAQAGIKPPEKVSVVIQR